MRSWNDRCAELELISAFAVRYHSCRHGFLDRMAKLDPVLCLICGSTAFATAVAGWPAIAATAALFVAGFSAMNLSFGYAGCATKHDVLHKRWVQLRSGVLHLKDQDEDGLRALEAEMELINGESPDQLRLLSAICEDEERIARGEDAYCRPIPWGWRTLANFFSLDFHRFQKAG